MGHLCHFSLQQLPAIVNIIKRSLETGSNASCLQTGHSKAFAEEVWAKSGATWELPTCLEPFLYIHMEKVVATRLNAHADAHNLSSPFQSAYRKGYSVETALLKVKEYIIRAFDNQNGVLLVLLDLSAAFDTVDHNTLLSHLKNL